MALLELIMAGVGPFEETRLDFSDGNGKPHMGPHIIAGVNGSGKSTVLRAIAATVAGDEWGQSGFPLSWWPSRLIGWPDSIAFTRWGRTTKWGRTESDWTYARAVSVQAPSQTSPKLSDWAKSKIGFLGHELGHLLSSPLDLPARQLSFWRYPSQGHGTANLVATYAPSLVLRDMKPNELASGNARAAHANLAFEGTVSAATVLVWLQNLRFSVSRLKESNQSTSELANVLSLIERAVGAIVGTDVEIDVLPGIEPQLRVIFGGRSLDFSQLPDGARNLLGWLVDFVRRRETAPWHGELAEKKPAVVLIDEIDAHLHPRWQRTILPALAEAFKGQEVQIIVTTHSPFVISSCPGARVHVLDVDEKGHATARPPVEAPVGQSVYSTIKDVFDVDSRFDISTERDLMEWNNLRRKAAVGKLPAKDEKRLRSLTEELAARSEELRLIVGTGPRLPEKQLEKLLLG